MTEKLTSMIEAFTNLNPNVQQAILVIGGIIAVAGPVLIVVGKIISSVGTILTLLPKLAGFIGTVKTAFMALNTTMLANPIMLIIAAIAALVAAFIYLWNNCDGFRQFWIDLWEKIKEVFNKIKEFITGFAKNAFEWGKDLVMGLVNGIKNCIGAVGDAVKSVADKIKSFLHFSVPDEGPLTEYESWMPDFMKGLAKGIEKSKGLVADAVDGLAADMVISPTVTASSIQAAQMEQRDAFSGILTGIQSAVGALQNPQQSVGNISIPVYIGGTLLDEVVVNAQNRQNLRSGGR
jgi:phage-related protein